MKTDELIAMLARSVEAVDAGSSTRTFAGYVALGSAFAFALMLAALGLNPMLRAYLGEPMFWTKLAFGVGLAASSLWLMARLARPGRALGASAFVPIVPVVALWLLAAYALAVAPAGQRAALIWGQTWKTCLVGIPLLSVPTLIATLLAVRAMAPARPVWTGAVAGAVAGGVGAAVYALHCPELAAPFLAAWYVGTASIPVVVGALVGRFALRW